MLFPVFQFCILDCKFDWYGMLGSGSFFSSRGYKKQAKAIIEVDERESKDTIYTNNPNLVITTQENVNIPNNVSVEKTARGSITYAPASGIDWDRGYRTVWGSCQASQGTVKLDSYSRARFERLITGSPYLDSGRVWSENQEKSFARSGSELYSTLDSGVAHTYYGIDA